MKQAMDKKNQPFRYRIVKDYILQKISSGDYASGDRIESEASLCRRFSLSRNTTRQALMELENENYLYRIQGKGTFIKDNNPARSKKVALLIYDTLYMTNPVTANLIMGIDSVLSASNYALDVLASKRSFKDEHISQMAGVYAGFLIGAYQIDELTIHELKEAGRPFLFVKNYLDEYMEKAMRIDFEKAGFMAAEHLICRKCRNLGLIYAGEGISISRDFCNGVKQACLEYGASLKRGNIIECPFNEPEKAACAVEVFSQSKPDGVICSLDEFAAVLCSELHKIGINVPENMLVTGCNNGIISQMNVPALTTIDIPTYALGAAAATRLLADIKGEGADAPNLIEPTLIERESTNREVGHSRCRAN